MEEQKDKKGQERLPAKGKDPAAEDREIDPAFKETHTFRSERRQDEKEHYGDDVADSDDERLAKWLTNAMNKPKERRT